jgi:hypothetical protein
VLPDLRLGPRRTPYEQDLSVSVWHSSICGREYYSHWMTSFVKLDMNGIKAWYFFISCYKQDDSSKVQLGNRSMAAAYTEVYQKLTYNKRPRIFSTSSCSSRKQRASRTYLRMSSGGFSVLSGTIEERRNVWMWAKLSYINNTPDTWRLLCVFEKFINDTCLQQVVLVHAQYLRQVYANCR